MSGTAGKDLPLSAAGAKDCETFASELVSKEEGRGYFGFGRRSRQVDGFRDPAVAIALKYGLHAHMMFWGHIVCGDKQTS